MDGGDPAGGSHGLAGLIDEHGECVLADLLSEYGLNLVDLMKPGSGYSPRRIMILVRQLPMESRTMAALRGGPQYRGWDVKQYFMAATIDAIRENTYAFVMANTDKKSKKPEPPEPVETPDRPRRRKKQQNAFAAMAARQLVIARQKKAQTKGE